MSDNKIKRERIQIIDALRGLAVVLMVIHHFLYDLTEFLYAPEWLFTNPLFDLLHYIFAGLFILLSGVSSRFSHSNLKRGLTVLLIAAIVTLVTFIMDMPILFGILHLLGTCMVFYALTHKLWDKIHPAMPFICTVLFILSTLAVHNLNMPYKYSKYLWFLGFTYPGFYSADYFPLFPWLFLFLSGTWVGKYIAERKLPEKFYTLTVPVFPQIGRKALIIYIVHQPVLYGVTMLIGYIAQRIF